MAKATTKPQLNVRLARAKDDILRAAAFVHGQSPGEFGRELLEQALEPFEAMASVQKAMAARADHAAVEQSKVSPLPTRPRKQQP
jgi:uncharacterized protein (DUF1778 family)